MIPSKCAPACESDAHDFRRYGRDGNRDIPPAVQKSTGRLLRASQCADTALLRGDAQRKQGE